ncbi:MAG: putative GTPase family [Devosia sp.]|nr:putative GTPase family [Devosia sp.]
MTAASPYAVRQHSVPVTIVSGPGAAQSVDRLLAIPGNRQAAIIRIEPPAHDHSGGGACLVCTTRGDIRALLFDLQEAARLGLREPFTAVIVDATAADANDLAERLIPGRQPAFGLRDHTVARNFHLGEIVTAES